MAVALHHAVDGPEGAPPVVLAGSLGSTLAMWEPQVAPLARAFRVVRFDLRGHGGSPAPAGPYALDDLVDDALGLLDRLGLERASWCGLSLGGMIGIRLAACGPERIERLVLVCTSARLGPPEMWAERAATVRAHGTAAVADAVVGRWFTPAFADREPESVAPLRAMIAATPPEGDAGCCAALEPMDLRGDLANVRAPTLVVCGADDPATPPEHGRLIAEGIRGAHCELVPGAAHLANVEQPGHVTQLIFEHLTQEAR